MTPEAEQLMNNPGEFIGNAFIESIINAIKMFAPVFIPAILFVMVGSIAFRKRKMRPLQRLALILLTIALFILTWIPALKLLNLT